MEVIGAGFGRTGTMSLKVALDQLGYKCHHMIEVFKADKEHAELWTEAYMKDGKNINWSQLFDKNGFTASVDFPSCMFYLELLEAYPNAKCILTYRDAESWWQSASQTILQTNNTSGVFWFLAGLFFPSMTAKKRMLDLMMFKTFPLGKDNEMHAKKVYEEHNERVGVLVLMCERGHFGSVRLREIVMLIIPSSQQVKRLVASDRLLVYQVNEGWAPLCKFLGKAIPDTPFPRVNDRDEFKGRIRTMNMVGYTVMAAAVCGIAMMFPAVRRAAGRAAMEARRSLTM
ncbi:hypothetical protein HDV00_002331 [Rhizophlyctis rosea]|nr:hypothetical protein HDV00_002331 [Rhizophlyctis rosea]